MTVETMLAIPGTLCSPAVFDALAARLEGRVRPVAADWMTAPGPWTVPAVAERLASRLDAPSIVLGHSTGGAIALQLAVRRPDLVAGLVLVGTGAHMRGHGDVDAIVDRVDRDWGPDLHDAILRRSFATPLPDAFGETLRAYAARVPREAVLEVLRSQRDLDLTAELARLTVPAVVVHGTQDATRTVGQARELADALPDAELRIVEAGHTPVHETPDVVAAAVLDVVGRSLTANRLRHR
ncbi:alpha/beta fold hydrolase [Pseudonocardia endophytica]|uniref:Pimeloyl-ACP methyl ester carboxylesterase n=1 Tax=Pseudonocardia endophytica TaxID=401976 RepID=A0A4R1HH12_PSEEN|nr:alpha/beta hydrolase [Pseudonocardia endophytica]TCK21494.1 pimeloyl-ACP methyl ester carboxylesterase [Pseudonocardia endophytica]